MKVNIKDRFGDEIEIKLVVTPEDLKTKAIEIKSSGIMSYKLKDLEKLIEVLQEAKEVLSRG